MADGYSFQSDSLRINISGTAFIIPTDFLKGKEHTRLGRLSPATRYNGDSSTNYFFFRDPSLFPTIIGYYATGKIHVQTNMCGSALKEELEFWQIPETVIQPCCYGKYLEGQVDDDVLQEMDAAHHLGKDQEDHCKSPSNLFAFCGRLKKNIHTFVEFPFSSKPAMVS